MLKAIFIQCFIFLCIYQGEIARAQTNQPLQNTLEKIEELINDGNWK